MLTFRTKALCLVSNAQTMENVSLMANTLLPYSSRELTGNTFLH